MLSLHQIQSLFRSGRRDQLVTALTVNGLPLPMPLQIKLAGSPAAAIALGLRRLSELTYGPTPVGRAMLQALLARQQEDGSFDGDALATAAALAAINQLERDQHGIIAPKLLSDIRDHAMDWLASQQQADGLIASSADRSDEDRALSSAFILFMLDRDELFRSTIRYADLLDWFECDQRQLAPEVARLWQLAQARRQMAARIRHRVQRTLAA
jgi:hypothetical protein